MANPLPPLDLLREYLNFSAEGVITLRKPVGPKDRRRPGDVLGNDHGNGYLRVRFLKRPYFNHRLVFYHFNGWCPEVVDHTDRNPRNNHPDNLRAATHSQNHANGTAYKTKLPRHSKFRGVTRDVARNMWIAQIKCEGKHLSLGRFHTEAAARKVYLTAASRLFPRFAPNS